MGETKKMGNSIKELWAYREMLKSLVRQTLRTRYRGSILGFLWNFVNPLLQLAVYTIVFSTVMRISMDKYYIFLFVGLIPWIFFSNSLSTSAASIVGAGNLIKKIYFPRAVLPIASVISSLVNMLFGFVVIFAILIFSGFGISIGALLYLPLVILIELLLAVGLALFVSSLNVYFRDLEHIIEILVMGWFYFTPVIYTIEMIPAKYLTLFSLNPMFAVIISYKDILYYKTAPQIVPLLITGIESILLIIAGVFVFNKLQRNFAEEI